MCRRLFAWVTPAKRRGHDGRLCRGGTAVKEKEACFSCLNCVWRRSQVHRKTLNPVFNETFQFGVPLNELHARKLHFSVYDFDRFSRHDLIGQVVVDNLLDFSEGSGDKPVWRDIVEGTAVGREPTEPAEPAEHR